MRAVLTLALVIAASAPAWGAEPDLRLVQAAADNDRAAVRTLLAARVDVNAGRADGATPLLWAAHWNDLEMADMLIAARANVKRRRRSPRHPR